MSELNLSLKHHRTLDEARRGLEDTVREAQARFGAMIQKVDWSPDRNSVSLTGTGFTGRVWVDAQEVHAVVDVPLLGQLLASPLVAGLKGILEKRVVKQLPSA
jgi:hypothetical protein